MAHRPRNDRDPVPRNISPALHEAGSGEIHRRTGGRSSNLRWGAVVPRCRRTVAVTLGYSHVTCDLGGHEPSQEDQICVATCPKGLSVTRC